ncbi:MAG: hypothetical protein ACYCX2_00475 [Christensenellales bacterium]
MLKGEILDFLTNEDFNITFSLDGNKEIHDKNRRFKNGDGSFDIVMGNIQNYMNLCPDKKPSFSMVRDPKYSFSIYNTFIKEKCLDKYTIYSSPIDYTYSSEKTEYSLSYLNESAYEDFIMLLRAFDRVNVKSVSPLTLGMFEVYRWRDDMEFESFIAKKASHSGPCIPGVTRLLVDVDGNLFPCERVSETSPCMKIGTLNQGFDSVNSYRLLNICQLTPECSDCWALIYCNLCARFTDDSGNLSADIKRAKCKISRNHAASELRTIALLQEVPELYGCNALTLEEY